MNTDLKRSHPDFRGNWEDLLQFLRLASSPVRCRAREDALRSWECYKLDRQLAPVRSSSGTVKKGAHIRALVSRIINLSGANLDGICVGYADLRGVILDGSSMRGAWLKAAKLENASLKGVDFSSCPGSGLGPARLLYSDLRRADVSDANLSGVDLSSTALNETILSRADLSSANLERATLVRTAIDGARLKNTRIYGISAWDLLGQPEVQHDLIITPSDQPPLPVDNLKVAHFVYLLLNNPEIRDVIDTVTTKVVLILGRFTAGRKAALETLRAKIRGLGLVPILFDFEPSSRRDLTETIQILANMARFVIADLTEAKSIPQELSHIIPNLPSVPVQPIIQKEQRPYAMFEHWKRFNSVLPVLEYKSDEDLADRVAAGILQKVENWEKGDQIERLQTKIKELKSRLKQRKK